MSHANSFFLGAALIYVYFSRLPLSQLLQWALLGFLAGLLVATRFQDATLLIIPIVGELFRAFRREPSDSAPIQRQSLLAYLTALVAFLIAFIPQLLSWKYLYGSYFSGPAPYLQYEGFNLLNPRFLGKVLFSSRHGLFFWHPVLFVGIVGLVLRPRRHTFEKTLLLLGFLATLYLVSSWVIWHAGASFGHRMFISVLPAFAFGLSNVINYVRPKLPKILLLFLVSAIILWNFGLIVQYATGMVPRQAEVPLRQLVRNQFTRVPDKVADMLTRFSVKRAAVEDDFKQ
jgi:hypothetical protein